MLRILLAAIPITFGALSLSSTAAQRPGDTLRASAANASFYRCAAKPIGSKQLSDCTKVAYSRLAREDRRVFDRMLDFASSGRSTVGSTCTFAIVGGGAVWSCVGNGMLCTCAHQSTGPNCACGKID